MASGVELVREGQSSARSRLMPTLGHSADRDSWTGGGGALSECSSRASTPCGSGPVGHSHVSALLACLAIVFLVQCRDRLAWVLHFRYILTFMCVYKDQVCWWHSEAYQDWLQLRPQHLQHVADAFQT